MIFFHTAGNRKIGIGNLIRSKSIAEKLKSKETIYIIESDLKLDDKIKFIPDNIDKYYIVSNREEALDIIYRYKSDYYNLLVHDILNLEKKNFKEYYDLGINNIIQINDSNVENLSPDIHINGDGFSQKFEYIGATKQFSGIKYNIIRDSLKNYRENNFNIRDSINTVTITFGGADPGRMTEFLLKEMDNNKFSKKYNCKINVIVGPAFGESRVDKIESLLKRNMDIYINPINIDELLSESDIILTMGGITSYESMYLGKITAIIGWNYMDYYARQISKKHLSVYLGNRMEDIYYNLLDIIKNPSNYNDIAYNGWIGVDGSGASRVAKIIDDYFKKFGGK